MKQKKLHKKFMKTRTLEKIKLDLLIIDIDDTFIYHRTVASANRIFLTTLYYLFRKKPENDQIYTTKSSLILILKLISSSFLKIHLSRCKIKKMFLLSRTAICLHFLNLFRRINNNFFRAISNEKMIRLWAQSVVNLGIKADEYQIPEKAIKKHINPQILRIYNSLKKSNPKMHVLAISQSFSLGNNPIKKLLKIDIYESNRFIINNKGIITGFKLNVRNAKDKKKIAEKEIQQLKPEKIAVIVEDYDDILLLELKNLGFIVYKKRMKRFIKHALVPSLDFS